MIGLVEAMKATAEGVRRKMDMSARASRRRNKRRNKRNKYLIAVAEGRLLPQAYMTCDPEELERLLPFSRDAQNVMLQNRAPGFRVTLIRSATAVLSWMGDKRESEGKR